MPPEGGSWVGDREPLCRRAGLPPIRAHPRKAGLAAQARCLSENMRFDKTGMSAMDIERINAIGTSLADLTQRTLDLRGYL